MADTGPAQSVERARSLARSGHPDAALDVLAQAIAASPADAALARASAGLHRQLGRHPEALAEARRAVALDAGSADAQCLLGLCLIDAGALADAAAPLQRAVNRAPGLAEAHNALAMLAHEAGRHAEAEDRWIATLEAAPDHLGALCNLANLLKNTARGDEAAALLGPAAEGLPHDIAVQSTRAVMANYDPALTAEQVAAHHRQHGQAVRAKLPAAALQPLPRRRRGPGEPLRVGFLSPDMREHSVASFLLPLLERLDRRRVRPYAYSLTRFPDPITGRFRAAVADFADVAHLPDLPLVGRIRADDLDILVDCAGLFEGGRPAALALRMAPVQATWLGYPNTTGLPNLDVRLVDAQTDPAGSETLATERLVRLEACFVSWRCLQEVPLPQRSRSRPVTFGCFNALSKVHEALLARWADLLARVPGSRLLLKAGALADPDTADSLRERLGALGVAPDRLELRGPTPTQASHLAAYGDVDIALDTFPYNGTTTTCEALWMGTPVVVLAGRGHPARVGASLLTAAGCGDWIAGSPQAYTELAASLASDRTRLAALHGSLRSRISGSALCAVGDFARRFAERLERL